VNDSRRLKVAWMRLMLIADFLPRTMAAGGSDEGKQEGTCLSPSLPFLYECMVSYSPSGVFP
jgi:hypothetical protein